MQGMPIPHLQRVGPITLPSSRLYRFYGLSLVTTPQATPTELPRKKREKSADQRSSCRLTLLSWPLTVHSKADQNRF
jgi:hypothetical protein